MNIADKFKEKFDKIKAIMLSVETPPVPPTPPVETVKMAMTDYTLADGTVISIDKLEVGGNVMAGEVAATDGSYTLPTGDEIKVVGGMISEITPKAAEAVEPAETEMKKDLVAMQSHIKTIEAKLSKQETFEAKFSAQDAKIEKLTTINKDLVALVELMATESKVAPIEKAKSFEDLTPFEQWKAKNESN